MMRKKKKKQRKKTKLQILSHCPFFRIFSYNFMSIFHCFPSSVFLFAVHSFYIVFFFLFMLSLLLLLTFSYFSEQSLDCLAHSGKQSHYFSESSSYLDYCAINIASNIFSVCKRPTYFWATKQVKRKHVLFLWLRFCRWGFVNAGCIPSRSLRPLPKRDVLVMTLLSIWWLEWSTTSLLLLPSLLSARVVVPIRVISIGQIDLF